MPKRKGNEDKYALVIYSALREWNLQPTHEECVMAIRFLLDSMADRHKSQLPVTFREPTQTKG